jgi:hypothetical protein
MKKNYNIIIDLEDEETLVHRNSFVEFPAVEYTKMAFSKDCNMIFNADKSQQKFMSVSILADTPIPRLNKQTGEEYTVTFTKDTIINALNKWMKMGKQNEISWQHSNEIITGVYMVESFIVNKGRVESPAFASIPDGSLIQTYWVEDKDQYEALLNDPLFGGFSIEISAKVEEAFAMDFDAIHKEEKIRTIIFDNYLSDDEKFTSIQEIIQPIQHQ